MTAPEQDFPIMNDKELEAAKNAANLAAQEQRGGLSGDRTLLGPKPQGAPGVTGVPWSTGQSTLNIDIDHTGADFASECGQVGLVISGDGNQCKYVCEYPSCSWKTRPVSEDKMMVLIEMYKAHIQQLHSAKEVDQAEIDKDQQAFKEATKLVDIAAHQDNRLDVISPVSYMRAPVRWRYAVSKLPTRITPVYSRLDLSHLGVRLNDNSIIAKMHNRAYAGAQLKDFSNANLEQTEEEKGDIIRTLASGGFKQSRNTREIKSMGEAVIALLNYELICRQLFVLDHGPLVIVRFLIEKINHPNSNCRITSVQTVVRFFKAAVKANADRVFSPDPARTYPEIIQFYNSMDWVSSSLSQDDPFKENKGSNEDDKKTGKNKGRKKVQGDMTLAGGRVIKFQGRDLCLKFQSAAGCSRTANSAGDGCQNSYGTEFVHVCNAVEKGAGCGSKSHGRSAH